MRNCAIFSINYFGGGVTTATIDHLSQINALAKKFSELVLIFEHSITIDERTDADPDAIREGTQKRLADVAFDMLGEKPTSEEEATDVLRVINHPLVFGHIAPAAAKLATAEATALISSETSLMHVMEFQTETLLNLARRDLPEANLLQERLHRVLEEMQRSKKAKSKP